MMRMMRMKKLVGNAFTAKRRNYLYSTTPIYLKENHEVMDDICSRGSDSSSSSSSSSSTLQKRKAKYCQQQQQQQHQMHDWKDVTKFYYTNSSSAFVTHFAMNNEIFNLKMNGMKNDNNCYDDIHDDDDIHHDSIIHHDDISIHDNNINGNDDIHDVQHNVSFTIQDAIELMLPKPIPKMKTIQSTSSRGGGKGGGRGAGEGVQHQIDMPAWTNMLMKREEQNPIVSSIDAKFRHDPAMIGNSLLIEQQRGQQDSHDDEVQDDDDDDGNKRSEMMTMVEDEQLCPAELIAMGSVWFLPHNVPKDPSLGIKPIRVELSNLHQELVEGDYLRVHHSPKRFPTIHLYDWGSELIDCNNMKDTENDELQRRPRRRPGVIVKEDRDAGYIIVNKPPGVPVHATVDNVLENVAGAVGRAILERNRESIQLEYDNRINMSEEPRIKSSKNTNTDPLVYVATPQRLDQNTSGLFVVATKKSFAAYFANLLRKKTGKLLKDATSASNSSGIQKKYRCLVCINTGSKSNESSTSMRDEVSRLTALAKNNTIVRHYLEPSLKAPRKYAVIQRDATWLECLIKICDISQPYPVIGNELSVQLSNKLWGSQSAKPKDCVAVVEVEVELLTGRTHQIRGQLSAIGFPLCGDEIYGGSQTLAADILHQESSNGYRNSEYLSLQCCELSFLEHKQVDKINSFRLENSWWSPWLREYTESTTGV